MLCVGLGGLGIDVLRLRLGGFGRVVGDGGGGMRLRRIERALRMCSGELVGVVFWVVLLTSRASETMASFHLGGSNMKVL